MEYFSTTSLPDFTSKTGFEVHGMLSDYSIFNKVVKPDPVRSSSVIPVGDSDFGLKSGANVIDKGVLLPNINANFKGIAPDLGAMEYNQKTPHYGKRP
jgi:hypothetical protein